MLARMRWALFILVLLLGGCGREDPKDQLESIAASAAGNRTTATGALIAAFKADQITVDDALTLAFDKLDHGEDTTAFAGAVLDMIQSVQGQLSQGGEFEIFWRRVGRLANKAAEVAYTAKRYEEAETLMLGGGTRWQNEAYWLRYPDHDALVAYVLTIRGRKSEAIQRLTSRTDLSGPAEEALEQIRKRR